MTHTSDCFCFVHFSPLIPDPYPTWEAYNPLLKNIISFSKAHPDATYIYLFWQGIFIKGTDACLDEGPHIIDGLCFSIGSQYSHNGVGIVRPAWIAFRQIISHRLFSFPLQLL